MSQTLKDRTVGAVLWNAVSRFSSQGIQFVFNLLIARILLPGDYGLVAMLNIFLAVSQAFVDSGFANALIQKQDRTEVDYNTVFWFNIVIACFFCGLLWLTAPLIASFYDVPLLKKVMRIMCFTLVINAFGAVQHTRLSIAIDFRTKAVISIVTVVIVGAVGLYMALHGYGIWALVTQSLLSAACSTALAWIFVKWRPRVMFSVSSLRGMFAYGSKLLAGGLLDTLWANMYNLVIGKVISPFALGCYNRSQSLAAFPSSNIYGLVQNVSFPVMCTIQEDREALREMARKFICMFAFVVLPMMTGLAAVADPFIRVILTDKWADAIPLLRILCFSLMWYPISAFNINFPNVVGRSDYCLRAVIINRAVDIAALVCTIPMGLTAMCIGQVVSAIVNLAVNAWFTCKIIGYGFFRQLADIFPLLLFSLVEGLVVLLVMRCFDAPSSKLVSGICAGAITYLLLSVLTHRAEYSFLIGLFRNRKISFK